ncbi:hypothetical protein QBC38DRAFT_528076 [Podospora fimiseda]|uniref:Ubiquitin 3 binding protein But2 C-terminal domain-containing protein n=1 Tax=Podospora fimiseda TaxID=252190 RepID=A0AAN7BNU1_9PEZI|nr:hypothetical protein QBC38DRAFT_528076 [Podospora fimiseda]
MRLLTSFLLLPSLSLAARNCTSTPQALPFTISELTYDFSSPKSTIGLYLSPPSSGTYSCISNFPSSWAGRDPVTNSLVWQSCILNIGRGVDDAVSFAVDWEMKEVFVGVMYTCSDDTRKQRIGRGNVKLEIECREEMCLTKERTVAVDVVEEEGGLSWVVEEYGGLWGYKPGVTKERLFLVSKTGREGKWECFDETEGEGMVRGGRCRWGEKREEEEVRFEYRVDLKVLTIRERGKGYEGVGVVNVPVICFEYDVPVCEVEGARLWVGGEVVFT